MTTNELSTATSARDGASMTARTKLRIDTDTHPRVFDEDLLSNMAPRWQRYMKEIGARQAIKGLTLGSQPLASRTDAWSEDGRPPGTDPEMYCRQLLDENAIDIAILNSSFNQSAVYQPPGAPAGFIDDMTRAQNMWIADAWLDFDDRLRGAICVPYEDPVATVQEIERCARDDRWVQVLLPFRTIDPLGHQRYWPMLDAASALGLPVSLHPAAQIVMSGAGWQSYYYEHHTALPSALFSQMASLVFSGTLDRFPKLQIVLQEGGWCWVVPYMARLDTVYREIGSEIDKLNLETPSDYVRRHFWFTTQPMEEPARREDFPALFQQFVDAGMGGRLMLATDYPHWDFDAPDEVFPAAISEDQLDLIFFRNALKCYPHINAPRV